MLPTPNPRTTDAVWVHTGKLIVRSDFELQPPVQPAGGKATFVVPDGTITTPMLAPGAAQQQIASYAQLIAWTLSTANAWTETPVQVTLSFSGSLTRFEFNVMLGCPTKGTRIFWSLMLDGAVPATNAALGAEDAPENNYAMMATGVYYATPNPGSHRVGFCVYGPSGSQIYNAIASTLYVTEQRR